MNKKLLIVILALSLLITLVACGKSTTPNTSGDPSSNAPATTKAPDPTPVATPEPTPVPEDSEAQKLLDSVPQTQEGIVSLWDINEEGKASPTDVQYEAAILAFTDVELVDGDPDPDSYVTLAWKELKQLRGNTMTNSISPELEEAFNRLYSSESDAVRLIIIDDKMGSFILHASDEAIETFVAMALTEENAGIARNIYGGMTNADTLFEEHPALIQLPLSGLASSAPLTRNKALSTLMYGRVEKDTVLSHLAKETETYAFNAIGALYLYGSDDCTDFIISAYKDPAHESSIDDISLALVYSVCPLLSGETYYSEKAYRAVLEFLDPANFTSKAPPSTLTSFPSSLKERHFDLLAENAPWFDNEELIAALEKADASPDLNSAAKGRIANSIENLKAN